jgi:two-component system, OmpR family, response regulator
MRAMNPRVLLVDDDVELLDLLRDYLTRDQFVVSCFYDGELGVAEALSGRYDIAVFDVTMPRLSGIAALARIRATSQIPVLMFTARGDDADRIVGLELGADDYVPKPCTPRELAARLRAILKRQTGSAALAADAVSASPLPLIAGQLCLWPGRRQAEFAGVALDLTSTEFCLLEVLARHAGQIVSKSTLSEQAMGRALSRFDRSIDVHISSIRQKLAHVPGGESAIVTVIRQGYQWLV